MTSTNGKRAQYIGVGTAILLAGGGGGLVGANNHKHPETIDNTEDITDLKVVQGQVEVRLENIQEDVKDNAESSKEILRILREEHSQ
jgi:hypothetical protein